MAVKIDVTFVVTLVEKKSHPHAGRICDTDKAFAIDGMLGKDLHVTRGKTYKFVIQGDNKAHPQPFYLTHDPAGGLAGDMCESNYDPVPLAGTFKPTHQGEVVFVVPHDFPQFSYYQSKESKFLGGRIICHG